MTISFVLYPKFYDFLYPLNGPTSWVFNSLFLLKILRLIRFFKAISKILKRISQMVHVFTKLNMFIVVWLDTVKPNLIL